MGYWARERYRGKGLMTAACRALVAHAFGELGPNRVSIACATENEKSCAIAERLGFQREGVVRQAKWLYVRFVDHVVYAALASEWRKSSWFSEFSGTGPRAAEGSSKLSS